MVTLVRDVMSHKLITVPYYATVDVVVDLILNNNVSGVPVVDDHGNLLGLITEFDVLELLWLDSGASDDFQSCEQFMTRDVKSVQASANLDVAARIFRAAALRRLLVLEGDQLVGILSRRDVLRCIRNKRSPMASADASN